MKSGSEKRKYSRAERQEEALGERGREEQIPLTETQAVFQNEFNDRQNCGIPLREQKK